jgi:uroporphyrinogen-III decarboxylase
MKNGITMTQRKRFLKRLEGEKVDHIPFFPDISMWYKYQRTEGVGDFPFLPGQLIPDKNEMHKLNGIMQDEYREMTYLELYRYLDFGLPVHIYFWYKETYEGITYKVEQSKDKRVETYKTPIGNLTRVKTRSSGSNSFVITEYPVKNVRDLAIMEYVLKSRNVEANYGRVKEIINEIGDQGVADLVITRSPFGKLAHEWMGLVTLIYALTDQKREVEKFLENLQEFDLEIINLAAESPAKIVIIGDNMDEYLVSPPYFKDYCLPFYRISNDILHRAGKKTSVHMDGNIKNLLPMIKQTGFDLLDGTTPAPVNNYDVEDLHNALQKDMKAYCGVPSSLFTTEVSDSEIICYANRIIKSLGNNVILNIGDILPPNGNINQVILLNQLVKDDIAGAGSSDLVGHLF